MWLGVYTIALLMHTAPPQGAACLIEAYPKQFCGFEDNQMKWCNGKTTRYDDGKAKTHPQQLSSPDLQDQMATTYPLGAIIPPNIDQEPGRIRYEPMFKQMYGKSRAEVRKNITTIVWAPTRARIKVTRINKVHEKLMAVGNELAKLPKKFKRFLKSKPQTFVWRKIAGTNRLSAHSFGIAVDIAIKHSHYWRWTRTQPGSKLKYRNKIPIEIVQAFERHGFIWGGRWYRYDTMHFEYRPELLQKPCVKGALLP